MVMTDPDRRRRRLSILLLLVIVVLAGFGLRYALEASSTAGQIQTGDEISGCRAEYRADVDAAEGELDVADDVLSDADRARSDLFLDGLVAAAAPELADTSLEEILAAVPDAEQDIAAATREVVLARAGLAAARETYSDAVSLSRTDPDRFLEECRRRFPT